MRVLAEGEHAAAALAELCARIVELSEADQIDAVEQRVSRERHRRDDAGDGSHRRSNDDRSRLVPEICVVIPEGTIGSQHPR
jgi:hypothetical protein